MANRLLFVLTIVSLFAMIHAAPVKAQQCECVPADVLVKDMATDYFPRATLIGTGTAGDLSGDTAQVTMVESFKGPAAGETTGVRSAAGECSYEIAPPGSDHFILALTAAEDGTPVTNRCTTFAAESAEAAQLSAAARAAMPQAQETPAATEEATPAATGPATSPTAEAEASPTPEASETPDATDDEGRSTFWVIVAVVSVAAAAMALGVALWMVVTGRRRSGGP